MEKKEKVKADGISTNTTRESQSPLPLKQKYAKMIAVTRLFVTAHNG